MTHPEAEAGSEFASQEELGRLYATTKEHLIDKGVYALNTPNDVCEGMYDGLPVYRSGEAFTVAILGDVLKSALPQAARVLCVGSDITIGYYPPFAIKLEDDSYVSQPPDCQFYINKAAESPYLSEGLHLNPNGDIFECDRMTEPREKTTGWLAATNVVEFLEKSQTFSLATFFGREVDQTRFGVAECRALQSIVDNLDALVSV